MNILMAAIVTLQVSPLLAGSFAEYPGASLDKKLTKKAQAAADKAGKKSSTKAFYTSDSFERVKAFYLKRGTEYQMPRRQQALDDGTVVKQAYFIFDGASGISASKDWLSVQNPLIGDFEFKDGKPRFLDVRKNTTSIQRVWSK
ncbi:MAG: hypothetical protein HY077_16695 [Elusimicrobia bacterium]|nr:hypothetical protein [Elusimicrobiota bacterium]